MHESEGQPTEISTGAYQLRSVLLDELNVKTEAFVFPHPKKINISFSVTEIDEISYLRMTSLKIEFSDNDGDLVASIDSTFKVQFAPVENAGMHVEVERELNLVASRISYPYHRQLISDLVTRMGMRPTFLPAVPDNLWQAEQEAAEEVVF